MPCAPSEYQRILGRLFVFEGGTGLSDDGLKGGFVINRDIGKDLAIKANVCGLEAFYKTAVGETLCTDSGAETCDPQSAEITLAVFTVTIGPVFALHLGILGIAEEFGTTAAVSFRSLDDAFTAGATGWSVGCSWHFLKTPRLARSLLGAVVRFVEIPRLTGSVIPEIFPEAVEGIYGFAERISG